MKTKQKIAYLDRVKAYESLCTFVNNYYIHEDLEEKEEDFLINWILSILKIEGLNYFKDCFYFDDEEEVWDLDNIDNYSELYDELVFFIKKRF